MKLAICKLEACQVLFLSTRSGHEFCCPQHAKSNWGAANALRRTEPRVCKLEQCQNLFLAVSSSNWTQDYCCGLHIAAAERFRRCGDAFAELELLQCQRPDCQNFFVKTTYNRRFCIQTHAELMDYRRKQDRATKRRLRHEATGRQCRWCSRTDDMTLWSGRADECSACNKQRARGSVCLKCGGPFFVQLTVRRDRMTGCPYCSRLTVYERLQLGWDL